jgi:Secretion system C-terminal sorting domain
MKKVKKNHVLLKLSLGGGQKVAIGVLLVVIFSFINQRKSYAQLRKIDYTISYEVKTSDFKKAKKGEKSYSNLEKVDLVRKIEEEDHIDIVVYNNGDEETTINHLRTNRYPEGAISPTKTVIDDKGVRTYDKNGKVLVNLEHSAQAKESMATTKRLNKLKKKFQMPNMDVMTQRDLSQMMTDKVQVKQIREGKMHMRKDNKEVIYDAYNQEIEEREFEGREIKTLSKKRFKKTTDNINYLSDSKDVTLLNNESGRKMYQFVEKSITSYKVKQALGTRESNNLENEFIRDEDKRFTIQPNPATDNVWIQIPLSIDNKAVDFSIVDMTGRIVIKEVVQRGLKQLNVKDIPNGVYLAQYSNPEGERGAIRFVKQ